LGVTHAKESDPSAAGPKDVNLANLVGRIKKLVILK
jgi:hypothetical protein